MTSTVENVVDDLRPLLVDIDGLELLDGNPRRGDVDAVARSLAQFGQRKPIVVRRADRQVLAVNHTLQAARSLGWSRVAVVWVDDDETTGAAYALADNRTAELGGYDEPALAAMLGSVRDADEALLAATAWADNDLAELLDRVNDPAPPPEQTAVDDVPAEPPAPVTQPGDVWILGAHRLACGDSFEPEILTALLGDATVDAVLMDPPYAIYGSSTGIASDIADDKMIRPFFEQLARISAGRLKWFGHCYVHCDWRSWATIWEGFKRSGMTPKNCLVWDKGNFGLGANWPNTHEFVGFFTKIPPHGAMTSNRPSGQRQVLNHGNVLRYPRVSGSEREHNAAKPVAMLELIIEKATDPGELVLDLFGGSGSTLIAAERAGRCARVIEMEPRWCDVICARFERQFGTVPILERTDAAHSFLAEAAA